MRLRGPCAAQGGQAAITALAAFSAFPAVAVLRSSHDGPRPRVRRMAPITPDASSDGQAVTLPMAPANDVSPTDTTAENDASRHSLTARFQAWNEKSVESTIEKGRVIKRGHEELSKEEWTAWVVEDLRLSPWCAERYVQISEHPILSDRKY